MRLLVTRSESRGLFRRRYRLDIVLDVSREERRRIAHHALARQRVYTEPLAFELEREADALYQAQRKLSIFREKDQGRIAWTNLGSVIQRIRSVLAFNVKVRDLLRGTTITCPTIGDLVAIETAITQAFDALANSLDHAAAFETGRELILAPEAEEQHHARTPPADWPRHARR